MRLHIVVYYKDSRISPTTSIYDLSKPEHRQEVKELIEDKEGRISFLDIHRMIRESMNTISEIVGANAVHVYSPH